ncbi:MAG: HNH endonuclease [Chlorobi bacterium]|nr:HNH endonuclease [Chlorobiota bacterium]
MKAGQKLWTRDELILAINLYCKLPFGRLHAKNPEVVMLASLIGRTPGSIAYKLVNFASLDPSLHARGIKGASNASKLDREIWNEFYQDWEQLSFESEKLRASIEHSSIEKLNQIDEDELPKEGRTRERMVKTRVNQAFFRTMILASHNNTCCITGLQNSELLVAGHIKPWSIDEKNRLNPRNGLAMNALHDKAFESGLLTITPEYRVKISSLLKQQKKNPAVHDYFLLHDGKKILLPSRFLPDTEFLRYHNQERFKN